jgi:peroxiredoxin
MKKAIFTILTFLIISCGNKDQANNEDINQMEESMIKDEPKKTLREKLENKKKNFIQTADEKKKIAYEDGIIAIKENGILDDAINAGDKAPTFTLPNATGKKVSLENELKKGPIVLTWYRGGWCPYCNMQLSAYQQRLSDFQKAGANLIAISPELPDKSLTTSEKHDLDFEVLSDKDNKVAKKYGIVFDLTEEVEKYYKSAFSFADYYGHETGKLPLSVTYVIAQDGKVAWAFLDPDYRKRAEPDDIINAVNNL